MTDLAPVYAALQKADAAGDTAGAKQLADYIRSQPAAPRGQSFDAVQGNLVPTGSSEAIAAQQPTTGTGNTLQVYNPLGDNLDTHIPIGTDTQNLLAGSGKSTMDLIRGAGQDVGLVSRQDVADSRALDAPLMATTAGKVGNIGTGILNTLPALAIPGVNTVAGAGVLGTVLGHLQPSTSTSESLTNVAVGGLAGAGSQYVGQKLAQGATQSLGERAAAAQAEESSNAARDAVLQEGRQAGYVVPPTAVNPSATATALESVSGKAATRQAAQAVNQPVTNKLVAQDLGLAVDQPLTREAIAGVRRTQAGPVYQAVKATGTIASDPQYAADLQKVLSVGSDLENAYPGIGAQANGQIKALVDAANVASHDAGDAVDLSNLLRDRAKDNYKSAFLSGGDPEKLALAKAQKGVANAVEDQVKRHLDSIGQPDLGNQWDAARTLVAKSYQAQAALKGNNVSAIKLAAQLQRDKPISGGMATAARFADQFEDVAKLPKSGAGVSKLAAVVTGGGMLGGAAFHSPLAMVGAAAMPAASYLTRKGILSSAGQALLATPSYQPGAVGTLGLSALKQLPRISTPFAVQGALAEAQQ
jgi:hypothetical protein